MMEFNFSLYQIEIKKNTLNAQMSGLLYLTLEFMTSY